MFLEERRRHVIFRLDVDVLRVDRDVGILLAPLHAEEGLDSLYL